MEDLRSVWAAGTFHGEETEGLVSSFKGQPEDQWRIHVHHTADRCFWYAPYEETTTINSKDPSKLIRKWTKDVNKMDRRCMPKINKDMKMCPISSHREMCMKSFQPSKDSGL